MTTLRIATAKDAEAIAAIYNPIVLETAISFETEPLSAELVGQRISATVARFPWLIACHDDRVVGYAYAAAHRDRAAYRWCVDVSAYVHADARSMRVGSKLYAGLLQILRLQGFHRAFAGITLPNAPSIALHESVGFQHLGTYESVGYKLDRWHSVGWWRLSLDAGSLTPQETIPFARLVEHADLTDLLV